MAKQKKTYLYFNKKTGDIMHATELQASLLGSQWEKVLFIKNAKGESVMRFNFDNAIVDVTESEGVENGQRVTN